MITHNDKKRLTAAYRYSYTRLALNFYGYFEAASEETSIPSKLIQCEKELFHILSGFLKGEEMTSRLEELRGTVNTVMENLTSYVECYQIYEYIFNRLERRFRTVKTDLLSQEMLLAEIEDFFADSQDSMILNSRIQSMVRETPIRFTKSKFFSIMKESLFVYAGSPKKNMEDFLERLDFYSRLQVTDTVMDGCEEFSDTLTRLKALDYKNLTAEQYTQANDSISSAILSIVDYSDRCLLLEELINDLLVLMLSKSFAVIELGDEAVVSGIVADILELFSSQAKEIPEEITARLMLLEGRQETYYERYSALSGDDRMDGVVWKVEQLLSSSPFVSLKMEEELSEEDKASELWIGNRVDEFCNELARLFDSQPKPVTRAVMAQILSDLPMWFHSMDEIKEYIGGGLDACTDINEKESCMELMQSLMETEYALV